MKIIITFLLLVFLGSSAFSEDYYSKFYSDFNNYNKTFTQKIDMNESEFRDPKEISLPWLNALVRMPKANGEISRGKMKDFLNSKKKHTIQNIKQLFIYMAVQEFGQGVQNELISLQKMVMQ